jgi:ABC-type multidrug transport system fused ATPase/permease subunit
VLFSGSVRDNITFGEVWDEDRFNEVVKVCCLEKDIERFPEGIDSKVSMQGSSFSGGQRARIALARALYSHSEIIIFDNCLSALDPKVRKEVHDNLLSDHFADRIFIFSTSSEDEVPSNSFFIHICDKKIKYFGPYKAGVLVGSNRHHDLL